ncbi:MAG: ribonuclease HII [Magnetococcales bacterium]|nr:ribonuclease HII [Magnetococcales bacterium]
MPSDFLPDFQLEQALWADGFQRVAGVDEVGRGPLAGPVVSAAVVFPSHLDLLASGLALLNDSKKVSPTQRERLVPDIRKQALCVGVGVVPPRRIDQINIRQAALQSMLEALTDLSVSPDFVLIDGRDLPVGLRCPGRAVIQGDRISASIAAASVVAKVYRDQIMSELAQIHPEYGWQTNQGYPTKTHRDALEKYGITEHHRLSFSPVKKLLSCSATE